MAYATLYLVREKAPERFIPDWETFVAGIEQEQIDHLNKHYFDRNLGWDYPSNFTSTRTNVAGQEWHLSTNAVGARRNPLFPDGANVDIATFGDSFTFGDEVNDDQTWQYYLSQMTGLHVGNYGVGGYGLDQMLLKYEEVSWLGREPSTIILMVYEHDINRAISRYRPALFHRSKQYLAFKPRFLLTEEGKLTLLPSVKTAPVKDADDLLRLIGEARDHDEWYVRLIEINFPYLLNVAKLAWSLMNDGNENLWESHIQLADAIIDRFFSETDEQGEQPVLVFVPIFERGGGTPPYREFLRRLRIERSGTPIIDLAEEDIDADRFRILPDRGHASAYGNCVIARIIAEAISFATSDVDCNAL
ncbi:MAG: hypothetical protein ACR2Q4_18075 [Geminicoccaceae bacterium]